MTIFLMTKERHYNERLMNVIEMNNNVIRETYRKPIKWKFVFFCDNKA